MTKGAKKPVIAALDKATIKRLRGLILARLQERGTDPIAYVKEYLRRTGATEQEISVAIIKLMEKGSIIYDTTTDTMALTHRDREDG